MASLISTGVASLLAYQRALATAGHNISNANTPGYSRQRVELTERIPQFFGFGYVGNGVGVKSIERVYDQSLINLVRTNTASSAQYETYYNLSARIDNMLADSDSGLSPVLQGFFDAIQDVSDDPTSIPAREVMLSEAGALVDRLHFLDARLGSLNSEVAARLNNVTSDINSLAQNLARMNRDITSALGKTGGAPPNDLLDQRDELLRQLSERAAVSIVDDGNGSQNVFIGAGQALVVGATPFTLAVTEDFPGSYGIAYVNAGGTTDITNSISGGELGGLLDVVNDVLRPSINGLGRIATGLATDFNAQHQLGQTLDGALGGNFFTVATPLVLPSSGAPAVVSASITDTSSLTLSDYELRADGGNLYTLTRLSDNQTFAIDTGGASPFTTTSVDGFTLTINAGAATGDRYIIAPVRNGARNASVAVASGRDIAIALPLRASAVSTASGTPANTGTGSIGGLTIGTASGLPLAGPVTMTFNAATNQFALSSPPGGTLAYNPATDGAGKQFTLAGQGGASFVISGTPADGDSFILENNVGGVGDNRNGLLLSGLQSATNLVGGGTASYQETFGQLVADVGTRTRQADINRNALGALLSQSIESRESVSGVNVDEEAADLLRFQQAYQASAQMISIADSVFQSLLAAVGR